jgi:hypothetical protein
VPLTVEFESPTDIAEKKNGTELTTVEATWFSLASAPTTCVMVKCGLPQPEPKELEFAGEATGDTNSHVSVPTAPTARPLISS